MIRYAVSFPGRLDDRQTFLISRQLAEAANSPRWRDIVLQEGGSIVRVNTAPHPSVRARNAQKLGERVVR